MSREGEFFVYLLEHYANYKNTTADKVLKQWDELQLTDFIYYMYEIYHTESIENAYEDIDKLMKERSTHSFI